MESAPGATITSPQTLGECSFSRLVSALEVKLEACVQNYWINSRDSSLSLSEIINAEDTLVKASRILRSMRNALAPINKIPPEILVHVCTFTPDAVSDFAHVCAQVCRNWRNTLFSSPSLWNVIRTADPLHINVYLVRSGKVPLNVYFRRGSPVRRFYQKVVPHMDRARLLYLSSSADDCGQILDLLEGRLEMVLLRDFHFKKGCTRLRLSASMMKKISSFAAGVTTLFLSNVDSHLPSLTFPRLLSFSLITHSQNGFKGSCVSNVTGFFKGRPMLEALDLHRTSYSQADDASTHIKSIPLHRLKSARLGGRPSLPPLSSLPYIEVDLLPYLHLSELPQPAFCEMIRRGLRLGTSWGRFWWMARRLISLVPPKVDKWSSCARQKGWCIPSGHNASLHMAASQEFCGSMAHDMSLCSTLPS